MSNYEPLTDSQWRLLEPLFPNPIKRSRGKPHKPWRMVVNSILYILVTGFKWGSLPHDPAFVTKSAAHRWFILWDKTGFLKELIDAYQSITQQASSIQLPHRRNRLPATKQPLITAVAS